jgi:hypothetical protein
VAVDTVDLYATNVAAVTHLSEALSNYRNSSALGATLLTMFDP